MMSYSIKFRIYRIICNQVDHPLKFEFRYAILTIQRGATDRRLALELKRYSRSVFVDRGGYLFCESLSLPMEYPIPKQVKPKLNIAMRSDIFIWHTPYYTIYLSPKVSQTNFPKGSKGEVKIKFYAKFYENTQVSRDIRGGWCYYIKKHSNTMCKSFA